MRLFAVSLTQWRHVGPGIAAGLDYHGVEAAARMAGITVSPAIFADLRIMEGAACAEMAKAWNRRR